MRKIKYLLSVLITLVAVFSCNHDELLEENPQDFFSPSNSFVSEASFASALADIYHVNRNQFYSRVDNIATFDLMGIDLDLAIRRRQVENQTEEHFFWNTFNADAEFVQRWYGLFYNQIFKANTVITRINDIEWNSEEEKNAIEGEARFLRAYYYRFLANMWGGVPLVLEETRAPRFDYTRDTRENVYLQCKEDLEFAVQHMKTVDEIVGGRAPRAAAYHILAEVNIQLSEYQDAIAAADAVINSGTYALMTNRFGVYADFEWRGYDYVGSPEPWGDVYWDLFRTGNFNRIDGNTEVIWNVQFEPFVVGGTSGTNTEGRFALERWWGGPVYWNANFQRDLNGVTNLYKDTLMGRPVGLGAPTDYLENQIWNFKGDFNNDIRNSKFNIQRTYYWNNPAGDFFGTPVTEATLDPANIGFFQSGRSLHPSFKKAVLLSHPAINSQDGENSTSGRIFKDWYIIRLAETYLLRAEAHFLNGSDGLAADDINVVRARAQATPVVGGEVDLDLILDERARELHIEEYRVNTLLRMGKLAEYLQLYNEAGKDYGYIYGDNLNLMPIPSSEIEANKDAVLEQNPGY